ncbi:fumarylacetoacetate hydrolase family protein [Ectobacillus antri]|jgi:2-keto-4-pentenoate hydratase/2-oxohepta-3-ene-1,7-dioic acid hydratase in catechol pathway|uniref:Fumarylacetoacetate hydrolase family protein n=1 Tax=Ectobacillus antri TaxID=2486280 RepID=A0ABT6H5D7_9BACI|nr:fumarylacetoacetate hydrolase family protein [Ectobacillus antri]MDG4656703.1 fumarylacetoacetate hydrolase family protein [Ectobacillus antri]MDG5753934.1 fumarylacetoacetate hydrolase family protein [Ectobacillus antri]
MRFVTAKKEEKVFVGVVMGDSVLHLREVQKVMTGKVTLPITMIECIEAGDVFLKQAEEIVAWAQEKEMPGCYAIEDVHLMAPIPRPRKNIICVGKNYSDHAAEMGAAPPEHVIFFTKAPTTVVGQYEYVHSYSHLTEELDYEGELAIIIGKKGKSIAAADALSYVFGYTIVNDITARDVQSRHKQFFLGKSFDTFCPMGPVLVHQSALAGQDLHIETKVNGELRQSASTAEMLFSIPQIIATLSQGMTLEPGDIIATGTPAGVGKGFHPPRFLKAGDIIEVTVEGIGTLQNTVK